NSRIWVAFTSADWSARLGSRAPAMMSGESISILVHAANHGTLPAVLLVFLRLALGQPKCVDRSPRGLSGLQRARSASPRSSASMLDRCHRSREHGRRSYQPEFLAA